jgi:hypothetical protein
MKPKKTIVDEHGNKLGYCLNENTYLPIDQFGALPTGVIRANCRKCENKRQRLRVQGKEKTAKPSEKEVARQMLLDLGYILDCEVPVWIQFLMKHNMLDDYSTKHDVK